MRKWYIAITVEDKQSNQTPMTHDEIETFIRQACWEEGLEPISITIYPAS